MLIFLISCQEDHNVSTAPDKQIQVIDGRLAFKDVDHFVKTTQLLQQNTVLVKEGRLLNLKYTPYYNTLKTPERIDDDFKMLDLYEMKVLLNADREVQIGEKIYLICNEDVKIRDAKGQLLETIKNEISYLEPETKSFKTPKAGADAKAFGFPSVHPILDYNPLGNTSWIYIIYYQWVRVSSFYRSYYYDAFYMVSSVTTNVEYFRREISDCLQGECNVSGGESGGTSCNTNHIRYFCGSNTFGHEQTLDQIRFRAVYWVMPYDKWEVKIHHEEDLELP